ncbi:MAG: VRR-NUC domain-containing protein [Sphingopyxis macrogoltabida]|uniref:VRR-NUC domain-containing protein n=1 Tax=Sphingopyxis macrogoltabida TaxID=33050 RepID=A0A2W5MTV2_SPHMC|nr:MAG: VRR-NUC domain-containing protein [Sphingopyxis macrogoltabida]
MREQEIQNRIRNALAGRCMAFRANVGRAWTGSRVENLPGRRVLVHDARPFSTGLPPGFSDLFGVVATVVTPDMVGERVGRFFGLEIKADGGRASDQQQRFLSAVRLNGGLSGIARSPADALEVLGL